MACRLEGSFPRLTTGVRKLVSGFSTFGPVYGFGAYGRLRGGCKHRMKNPSTNHPFRAVLQLTKLNRSKQLRCRTLLLGRSGLGRSGLGFGVRVKEFRALGFGVFRASEIFGSWSKDDFLKPKNPSPNPQSLTGSRRPHPNPPPPPMQAHVQI